MLLWARLVAFAFSCHAQQLRVVAAHAADRVVWPDGLWRWRIRLGNNMMLTSSIVSALGVAFLTSMKGVIKDRIMDIINLIVTWRK